MYIVYKYMDILRNGKELLGHAEGTMLGIRKEQLEHEERTISACESNTTSSDLAMPRCGDF
jgi:hypothetical protein